MTRITKLQRRHEQLGEEALHAHRDDPEVVQVCLKVQREIAAELHSLGALTLDEAREQAEYERCQRAFDASCNDAADYPGIPAIQDLPLGSTGRRDIIARYEAECCDIRF